jgi:molecular chaperone DnaJ
LLLTIKVKEHEYFKRQDKTIETEVVITLVEALLGAKLTIQTIDGPLTIETVAGLTTGDKMTLKHYGVPEFNPPENYDPQTLRGDHVVKFRVLMPQYDPNGTSTHDQTIRKILELD